MNNFEVCQKNYDNQEPEEINPCSKCKARMFGLCGVIDCDYYLKEDK